MSTPNPLQYAVYIAPPEPIVSGGPPGLVVPEGAYWSPTTVTLIYGTKDAILIDALWLVSQAEKLADWIGATAPGHTLTTICVTHGHADYWFGAAPLLKRSPGARFVATPGTVEVVKKKIQQIPRLWGHWFPNDKIQHGDVIVESLGKDKHLWIEGHDLEISDAGFTDTDQTTYIWVPPIRLVCGGRHCLQWCPSASIRGSACLLLTKCQERWVTLVHICTSGVKQFSQVDRAEVERLSGILGK